VPRSRTGSTTRDAHYDIRGGRYSKVGFYLCVDGSRTGTHCGHVVKLNETVTYNEEHANVTVGHLGTLDICGVRVATVAARCSRSTPPSASSAAR
jgi:hypothetical protein